MKVIHVVQGKVNPNRSNGVNSVIYGLTNSMNSLIDVEVIGISKGVKPNTTILRDKVKVYLFPNNNSALNYLKSIKNIDIVHLHSVWQWTNVFFSAYLRKVKIPYVLTIHSGLSNDRLKQSKYYFKMIFQYFFQKKIMDSAKIIQALTREEILEISRFTKNKSIHYITNGVDLELTNNKYKIGSENIKIGYLGRFGIEKNIESLIKAISLLHTNINFTVELVGPLNEEYNSLHDLVKKLKLENIIKFIGPLYGEQKYLKMQEWNGYIHIAKSDVVSIALMEAFALGIPSIVSRTSQVSYFYKSGAFVMVEPVDSDISRGIEEFLKSEAEWLKMSNSAKDLVKKTFNWDMVALEMEKMYQKALS